MRYAAKELSIMRKNCDINLHLKLKIQHDIQKLKIYLILTYCNIQMGELRKRTGFGFALARAHTHTHAPKNKKNKKKS